jgi:hypothetical protein
LLATWWPDGGWNCDRNASGNTSSFMETLLPLRALAIYANCSGSAEARNAADRAAEIFLTRRLFKRQRDGAIIDPWCVDALDLLESKRLPDGGFPAEASYYRVTHKTGARGRSLVDWSGVSRRCSNERVTLDALAVLTAAGRLAVDSRPPRKGEAGY